MQGHDHELAHQLFKEWIPSSSEAPRDSTESREPAHLRVVICHSMAPVVIRAVLRRVRLIMELGVVDELPNDLCRAGAAQILLQGGLQAPNAHLTGCVALDQI